MDNFVKIEDLLKPLEFKDIEGLNDRKKRVLFFDPRYLLNLEIARKKRVHCIFMDQIFPDKKDGFCSCGCGKKLEGRRKRWATGECSEFAVSVWAILSGRTPTIGRYLEIYYGWLCQDCGCKDTGHKTKSDWIIALIKIDHIIPVKHGGGFCWLSNYRLRCHDCHVKKTNEDFGWNKNKVAV